MNELSRIFSVDRAVTDEENVSIYYLVDQILSSIETGVSANKAIRFADCSQFEEGRNHVNLLPLSNHPAIHGFVINEYQYDNDGEYLGTAKICTVKVAALEQYTRFLARQTANIDAFRKLEGVRFTSLRELRKKFAEYRVEIPELDIEKPGLVHFYPVWAGFIKCEFNGVTFYCTPDKYDILKAHGEFSSLEEAIKELEGVITGGVVVGNLDGVRGPKGNMVPSNTENKIELSYGLWIHGEIDEMDLVMGNQVLAKLSCPAA